ncbi:MAG: hypothetical protein R6V12_10485, partial [Candidatus Hydrogenedentota bacterium]
IAEAHWEACDDCDHWSETKGCPFHDNNSVSIAYGDFIICDNWKEKYRGKDTGDVYENNDTVEVCTTALLSYVVACYPAIWASAVSPAVSFSRVVPSPGRSGR